MTPAFRRRRRRLISRLIGVYVAMLRRRAPVAWGRHPARPPLDPNQIRPGTWHGHSASTWARWRNRNWRHSWTFLRYPITPPLIPPAPRWGPEIGSHASFIGYSPGWMCLNPNVPGCDDGLSPSCLASGNLPAFLVPERALGSSRAIVGERVALPEELASRRWDGC